MRIGLFTNNYRPLRNGVATAVSTAAEELRAAGHAVTVIAPRYGSDDEPGCLRIPGVRAPTHHAYVLPLTRWPGVARALARLELDVYHAHHPFLLGSAAARSARAAGRPLVFTYHTRYERYGHYATPAGGLAPIAGRLALARALRFADRADLVLAPAPSLARELVARGLRTPVAVVPTGVPLPAEPFEARELRRQALGLAPAAPLCLSVGRLAPEKNQRFLLHAFAALRTRLPEARLLLVGDGDDRRYLERDARRLGLGGCVVFAGAVARPRVLDYCLAADLFLFPSTTETQGLVALEALAAGLPVVAVRSAAAEDLLAERECLVLAPEEPDAFARSVVALWHAPQRRAGLAGAGREVARRHAPAACAARLIACYEEALARRRAPVGTVRMP